MTTASSEMNTKVKKTVDKITENIYIVANDPSLAYYQIQEHIRRVLQPMLTKRQEIATLQRNLQGHCYDIEYAISANNAIAESENCFQNIQDLIKSSIFLKQQLKYEETRSRQNSKAASVGGRLRFGKLDTTSIDYGAAIREASSLPLSSRTRVARTGATDPVDAGTKPPTPPTSSRATK